SPSGAAAALSVSATSMLYAWEPYGSRIKDNMRAARCLDAIDAAITAHSEGRIEAPSFPKPVTKHFVGGDATNPCAGDPQNQFDHYRASTVWSQLDVAALSAVPPIKDALLGYFSDALAWYASYMAFQDARGWSSPSRLMKWESVLGRLSGRLASLLPPEAAIERLVEPAVAMGDAKARSELLADLLDGFAHAMVEGDLPVDADFEAVWRTASDALFETARGERSGRYDPDETPLSAAAFAHYGLPVFEPGWSRAAELSTLLGNWVAACARYRFSAGLVSNLVDHAGVAFAPHPGLDWLEAIIGAHRSTTPKDWRSEVGRPAGELLATLWSRSTPAQRRADVVRF
ncbi:hypothetical protein, partial [Acetobacter fabarum]|uniref:hypothetical protein n=1 Tax=Acetobacter fabarum TaxID=483199 RepID=UPI0033B9D5DC